MSISTHVLNATTGRPAAGLEIVLSRQDGGRWHELARRRTDEDGRVADLAPGATAEGWLAFSLGSLQQALFQPGALANKTWIVEGKVGPHPIRFDLKAAVRAEKIGFGEALDSGFDKDTGLGVQRQDLRVGKAELHDAVEFIGLKIGQVRIEQDDAVVGSLLMEHLQRSCAAAGIRSASSRAAREGRRPPLFWNAQP